MAIKLEGCGFMPEVKKNYSDNYRKTEKINGVIYNMSPAANFRHGIVNGNIHRITANALRNSVCRVFMENLDFKYHPDINDDYIVPDIMVACDRKKLKGGAYYGTPKFVVETLSPSTSMRDMTEKKDIYEQAGVDEYWIVLPREKGVNIYYLENGKYVLKSSYILEDDKEEEHYNADTVISLRRFPDITMTLEEIFENVDE